MSNPGPGMYGPGGGQGYAGARIYRENKGRVLKKRKLFTFFG